MPPNLFKQKTFKILVIYALIALLWLLVLPQLIERLPFEDHLPLKIFANLFFVGGSIAFFQILLEKKEEPKKQQQKDKNLSNNITELKRTETALKTARESYLSIFNNTPTNIFYKDTDNRFIRVNQAAADTARMTITELEGKHAHEIFPPEEQQNKKDDLEIIESGNSKVGVVDKLLAKTGEYRWLRINKSPYRNAYGEIIGILIVGEDITEQRQAEEALRQLQKMEAIGRLAGGIAHDFNNMLSIIRGCCELLIDQVSKDKDSPLMVDLKAIQHAGRQAAVLTQHLLTFSRKQIVKPELINFESLLESAETLIGRVIGKEVNLKIYLAKNVNPLMADPNQLEQILVNLAVNARDAMPEGGDLTIEVKNVVLNEAYATENDLVKPGSYVMIAVRDTGMGMSDEIRSQIFEPFFTTKPKGQGTGLGLATTYGIVKQSKGFIEVDSQLGEGTTFKLYFPQTDAQKPAAPKAKIQLQRNVSPKTILIVEDEFGIRQLASRVLQANGYKTIEAKNGDMALKIVQQYDEPIDLLLTDVVMPILNGPELAEKALEINPNLKILFMSGYTGETLIGHDLSSAPLIQKPFSPKELLKQIDQIFSTV